MTDLALDVTAPARRNANLGTPDEEEIFASFDTRIIRRFFAFLKPHRALLIGAPRQVERFAHVRSDRLGLNPKVAAGYLAAFL